MLSALIDDSHFKRVRKACIPCRNAKVGCDNKRPCSRCSKHGFENACVDAARKQRPTKKNKTDAFDDFIDAPSTSMSVNVGVSGGVGSMVPSSPLSFLNSFLQDESFLGEVPSTLTDSSEEPSPPSLLHSPSLASQSSNCVVVLKELDQIRDSIDRLNESIQIQQQQQQQQQVQLQQLQQRQSLIPHDQVYLQIESESSTHLVPAFLNPQAPPSDECFALWDLKEDYLLIDCTQKFADLLGYIEPKELVLCFGLPRFIDFIHPKFVPHVRVTCQDAQNKNITTFNRPCLLKKKDGMYVHVFINIRRANGILKTRVLQVLDRGILDKSTVA